MTTALVIVRAMTRRDDDSGNWRTQTWLPPQVHSLSMTVLEMGSLEVTKVK